MTSVLSTISAASPAVALFEQTPVVLSLSPGGVWAAILDHVPVNYAQAWEHVVSQDGQSSEDIMNPVWGLESHGGVQQLAMTLLGFPNGWNPTEASAYLERRNLKAA